MKEETRNLSIGQALDLGCELAVAGNHQSAIGLFHGVLVHEPENFEAIERLGSSLFEIKSYHEALYWFWRGRKLGRRNPMALTNYGLTVAQLGHWEEALPDLERAVHLAEKNPKMSREAKALVYNNLGNTLEKLQRYPQALAALDKGIAHNALDGFPHYNRGIVLLRLNRQREAIEALDTAIAINPKDADAHYNRGMGRLLLGDLKAGFRDYEWRLLTSENKVPNLGLPASTKWTGTESIEGKTILVHGEQGLGDDIQFFRFLPLLVARKPARILVMVHNATAPLIAGMPNEIEVLTPGSLVPTHDRWVALMSLPMCLGIEEATIPPPWRPQIAPERVERWRNDLEARIGVCWAGNWMHKNDKHRSIPLERFATIFGAPCNFVSLQQMQPVDVAAFPMVAQKHPNLSALKLDTFRDTAAVILNLDLVITVDTAIAHLAGSLGVPTWVLIPAFGADWRWQIGREDSPWYPTARLWRQPKVGDWDSVLARVRNELAAGAITRAA